MTCPSIKGPGEFCVNGGEFCVNVVCCFCVVFLSDFASF